jgi:hypothetical protein
MYPHREQAKGVHMGRFNLKQRNTLLVGTRLAMEIPSTSESRRAFIVVGAYRKGSGNLSKFLNNDKGDIRFYFRKYEIEKIYIERDWDVSDDELVNSIHVKNIENIDKLEEELSKYVRTFLILLLSGIVITRYNFGVDIIMTKRLRKKLHKVYINDVVFEVSTSDYWRDRLPKTKYGFIDYNNIKDISSCLAKKIKRYKLKYEINVKYEDPFWVFTFRAIEFKDVWEESYNSIR